MGVLETYLATLISLVRRQGAEHLRTASPAKRLTSPRSRVRPEIVRMEQWRLARGISEKTDGSNPFSATTRD
jgi:hypothetical protein